jgi:hypothetical protein
MDARINLVKVFTATKTKDRESIGETVTQWIATNPNAHILKTFVTLTSDDRFHCISIVLVCRAAEASAQAGEAPRGAREQIALE